MEMDSNSSVLGVRLVFIIIIIIFFFIQTSKDLLQELLLDTKTKSKKPFVFCVKSLSRNLGENAIISLMATSLQLQL
jgi:hypothetical protein